MILRTEESTSESHVVTVTPASAAALRASLTPAASTDDKQMALVPF